MRSDEWPAWFSFWFSGCWRALAKGTAWAFFYSAILLLLLPKPPHGGPGREPNHCAEPLAARLPFTTQLDFELHTAGLSACLITERFQRAELYGWGRRLYVNECHLFMDQWMRFGDRDRRIVLCWPNSGGGYSRRNRASPRCLQCAGAVCFVNREAAARSILARSTNVIISSSGLLARQGRRLMRRTSRGGCLSRSSTAKRRKKVGFGTPSSKRTTENQTKARRLRSKR